MDNMDVGVLRVFIFGLITAVATGLGAVPFLFLRSVSKRATAFAAAIASGLMLGASFGLLLEGSEYGAWQTLIGAGAGVLFIMLGARYLSTHSEIGFGSFRGQGARRILLVVATMTAHSFAEGVAVGDMGPKGEWVLRVTREQNGLGAASSDQAILDWQSRLARLEGIWAGPTGCVTLPALASLVRNGSIHSDATVVCLVTETGFKSDIDPPQMSAIQPTAENIRRYVTA